MRAQLTLTYSEYSETSKMELSAIIANGLKPMTVLICAGEKGLS